MIELLKLCGYEESEIELEILRVERVFQKLGITNEDIERAKQRLTKYYDVELLGVRKMLGMYLRDVVNLVLAREEGKTKIIYAIMAEGFDLIASAFGSKSKEVFVAWPESLFEIVYGPTFFDKIIPVLEAAEAQWLKAGVVSHCGNVKMLVGLIAMDLIPKPDMLIASGFLCDTAPKTVDLLHEFGNVPMAYFGTCLDRELNEPPEAEKKRLVLAAKHMRELIEKMQDVLGIKISDDDIWAQLDAKKNLRSNMARLHDVLDRNDRPPISETHGSIIFLLARLAANWTNVPRLIDTTNILYSELEDRVNKGIGVVEKGAPRILALVPASFTDPRLEYLIEELGMSVTTEIDLFWPDGRRAPSPEKSSDPYITLCAYLHDSKTRKLTDRIRIITEACRRLKIDGVLCRSHVGCRTIAGDIIIIKDVIKKELGLPAIILESESFDPRVYNHELFKRKLELFKMMLDSGPSIAK